VSRTVRALLVRPGEEPQIITIPAAPDPATLDALSGHVGGYLEAVMGDDWHLYCDEDGDRKGLPPNPLAAAIVARLEPRGPVRAILGPCVFLGQSGGAEADVPPRVEDVARRLTMRSLLEDWDDADAVPLTPAAGPDAQRLQVAAAVVRRAVVSNGWADTRNAVPCARVGAAVLERLGHTAQPVSVAFMALSQSCADTGGQQGHCIGILSTGQTDPHGPGGGGWDGHLVLLVDGVWLLDISAPQFNRPAQGIDIPEPILARLPHALPGGLTDGVRLLAVRRDGSHLRYAVNAHTEWQALPDWAGRAARVDAAADESMRALAPYLRMMDGAADYSAEYLRRPWRCATCHQGVRRMNLPDGTTQYVHARPWEIKDGHPAAPEQVDDLRMVNVVCDFCGDPNPVWAYTGPNVIVKPLVNPLTGEPVKADDPGYEGLGTEWAGCDICDRYVTAGDLEGLAASALRSKANRTVTPDPQVVAVWKTHNMQRWVRFVPHITRRRLVITPALDPVNPRALPRIRSRLVGFLSETGRPAFGQIKGGIMVPGPDAGLPDEMTVRLPEVTEQQGDAYCSRIVRGLQLAELYHVSEDFTGLALTSGADLTDLSVTPEELPAPHGLIMWATPIMTADARHTRAADEAQIIAASWTTVSGLGVWINWYVRTDQIAPGDPAMRQAAGVLLPWANGSGLRFGHTVEGVADAPESGFPEHDADGMSTYRTLLATWFLILQPGVASQQVHTTNDKQLLKRARRAGQPPPSVRLVDLRHTGHRNPAGPGAGAGRQISVRFPVRGHWRRQAYGKGRQLRRSMYIAPFMKGPPGAPLKSGGAVPVVRVLQ
jgi:hypothetical protein